MDTVEWVCVIALLAVPTIQFLPITISLAFCFARSVSGVVTAISCALALKIQKKL